MIVSTQVTINLWLSFLRYYLFFSLINKTLKDTYLRANTPLIKYPKQISHPQLTKLSLWITSLQQHIVIHPLSDN